MSPKFKFKREPNVCFSSRSARPLCNCKSRHNGDFNGNDPSANHELEIGWFHHQIAEMQRYIYCHENSNQRINAVAFFKERTRVCYWNPNTGLQKKETVHLRKLGSVLKKKKNQAAATRQSSAVSDLVISVYCCTRFQKKYQRKKNWVCNLVISPSQRKYQSINKPANSSVKPQPSREFPELFSPSIIQPVIFQK